MKISVSNIAWETPLTKEYLGVLREEKCDGLEFCPSMIWKEPVDASTEEVRSFGQLVRSSGLEFSSMHSLTYPHPEMNFFEPESRKKLVSYIVDLSKLCNALQIPVMVFGSGKSRKIGDRDRKECYDILADTFREMAEKIDSSGAVLLIESLSKVDADSINSMDEGMELVRRVNHKKFALHVDLKATFAEKENQDFWSRYISEIKHCHVSDPGMKPPSAACPDHAIAAKAMKKAGYNKYISLEITRVKDAAMLREAINFIRKTYFI